jgi:hypothetical protein
MSAFELAWVGDYAKHGFFPKGRDGAGDEGSGSDFAAMAKKITCWQAAEILGVSTRQTRCWHERHEEFGYDDGLFDRRRGQPSPKRVP